MAICKHIIPLLMKDQFNKLFIPCFLIIFVGLISIAPLYLTMSLMTRQMEKIN